MSSSIKAPSQFDCERFIKRLRQEIKGEVLDDPASLGLYATDASMYQMMPWAVVLPRDRADALRTVRLAGEYGVTVLPRGGGTSLAGQAVNRAVVIDFSKHMNRLLELNIEERWARVEPGLVRDELNALIKSYQLFYAPDPATSNRANIGGIVANNSAGERSIKYGMAIDHVLGVDLALATGEVLNLGPIDAAGYEVKCHLQDREGEIYRGFREIISANREEILARYPKVVRRSGGYPLDAFVGAMPWNMAKLVAQSAGTLGTMLEIKVKLEPLPPCSGLCLAHFSEMGACLRAIAPIVSHGPTAVELIDGLIIRLARKSLLTREICQCVTGEPAALLIIEAQGQTMNEVMATLGAITADLTQRGVCYELPLILDPEAIQGVHLMRSSALGLMTTVKGPRKPTPYVEDAAIPPESLPEYIEAVLDVCKHHERPVSLFAHASVGLLHIRPMHDLHQPEEIEDLKRIQDEVFELVVKYKGSFSGEHGDGIVRSGFNERFFGKQLYEAFRQLKRLFDPQGLMNPGKIIDAYPVDRNMRFGGGYQFRPLETLYHYREDNGIQRAIEQCTGVGACRKTLLGTMCPSYIATRDEAHSTRGRANAMRLAMTGQLGMEGLGDQAVHDVLDLCLSCKGCKKECPNTIDMGRLKAEATHQYHLRHGFSLRDRIFRDSADSAALATGWLAPLVNGVMANGALRWAMDRFLGIDKRRPLPKYARQPLSVWHRKRGAKGPHTGNGGGATAEPKRKVVLFDDTYMEYYQPAVGRAAIEVLEAAGFEVELVRAGDSQRPAISKGFLDVAKQRGTEVLKRLEPFALQGLPILVCEPSCASSLMDDLPDLTDDETLGRTVAAQVKMIDTFLAGELNAGRCTLPWRAAEGTVKILFHGHCHQKALDGIAGTRSLLERIPSAEVSDTQAGCCGMAGSFGYEKEHYDLSVKVAEDRLLPALRAADATTIVVANGFSCRHQIADLAGRPAGHVIEIVRQFLDFPATS